MYMKPRAKILALAGTLVMTGILAALVGLGTQQPANATGHGNLDTLRASYQKWRSSYEMQGGDATRLRLPLAWSRALSSQKTSARGLFELNLMDGLASVKVSNLEPGEYDAWLVDNQEGPGRTVIPESGDTLLQLGALQSVAGSAELATQLDRQRLEGFKLDMVVITPRGKRPDESILIAGAPGLFQQLYYVDKPWAMAEVGGVRADSPKTSSVYEFLLPTPAHAASEAGDLASLLANQVAKGRQLFTAEKFEGNGRTCATCHRPDRNFTIDPNYIAKLPKDDPLFVAEYNSQLKDLENPKLLRQFGLILANVDGFDRPGVLRSVPHTLGLATSIDVEISAEHGGKGEFPEDEAFRNALGWSGDGSPGTGSLREFAMGAIAQHSTKTLRRVRNVDFRLPTDDELDAIEAYLLSLGRAKDFDLGKLNFKSEVAQRGKELFNTKENPCRSGKPQPCYPGETVALGQTANCNGCHMNAGARSSTTFANPTRDTGVENMRDQAARLVVKNLPFDGGFGQGGYNPDEPPPSRTDCGPDRNQICYGEGRFNTPPLIEAADTGPFFHNNSVNTLEEAIASYNGDAFNNSPGAKTSSGHDRRVKLESTQVVAIALFLRHLNALENILVSNRLDSQATKLDGGAARETIRLAMIDTTDAIDALEEARFQTPARVMDKLDAALTLEKAAQWSPASVRNSLLQMAMLRKKEAQNLLVSCNPNGVGFDTDPDRVYSCKELNQYEVLTN